MRLILKDKETGDFGLSPSQSSQWIKCPNGYLLSQIKTPYRSKRADDAANLGTSEHLLFESLIKNQPIDTDFEAPKVAYEKLKPLLDHLRCKSINMIEGDQYDDTFHIFLEQLEAFVDNGFQSHYFETTELKLYKPFFDDLRGMIDWFAIRFTEQSIDYYIADYKTTKYMNLEAKNNTQLFVYLALLHSSVVYAVDTISNYSDDHILKQWYRQTDKRYHAQILQPYNYNFPSYVYDFNRFHQIYNNLCNLMINIKTYAETLKDEKTLLNDLKRFNLGQHCTYCGVKKYCPKIKTLIEILKKDQTMLTDEDILVLLQNRKTIATLLKQLEDEEVQTIILKRTLEEDYDRPFDIKLKKKLKRFRDEKAVASCADRLKIDVYEQKIKSPSKVINALKEKKVPKKDPDHQGILDQIFTPKSTEYNLIDR